MEFHYIDATETMLYNQASRLPLFYTNKQDKTEKN